MEDQKTLLKIAEQMAEAIREWNRAKLEREEWKPIANMVPPDKYLNNAKKANVLLTQALEEYEQYIKDHPDKKMSMETISQPNQDNALKVIEQLAQTWAGSTVYDVQKAFQSIANLAKESQSVDSDDPNPGTQAYVDTVTSKGG